MNFRSPALPEGGNHSASGCVNSNGSDPGLDNTSAGSMTVPRYAYPGAWTHTGLCLGDRAGNYRCYTEAQVAALGRGGISVVDDTPPVVDCAPADGDWHAANVALACTATDSASGIADAEDMSFTLSTSVADGTEDADAATGTRSVCDRSGNCTTAGPIAGNKIDRLAPTVTIASPVDGATVAPGSSPDADYSCEDVGFAIDSCVGDVPDGSAVDGSTGSHTFSVTAQDTAGNETTKDVTYEVGAAPPADADEDSVPDSTDNCPSVSNVAQTNTDDDPSPLDPATPTAPAPPVAPAPAPAPRVETAVPTAAITRPWAMTPDPRATVTLVRGVMRVSTGYSASCPAGGPVCTGRLTLKLRRRSPTTGRQIDIFLTARVAPMIIKAGTRQAIRLRLSRSGARMVRRLDTLTATLRGALRTGEAAPVVHRATVGLTAPPRER